MSVKTGTAAPVVNWGGEDREGRLENERRGREFVRGSGAILLQKIVKSRGSEMIFFNILHEIFSAEKFPTVFVMFV